jgi:hypothetical protein
MVITECLLLCALIAQRFVIEISRAHYNSVGGFQTIVWHEYHLEYHIEYHIENPAANHLQERELVWLAASTQILI